MTEFETDGRFAWGAFFTGYDGNLCLVAIINDFHHLPRMLNYYCREYVEHKGRRVERDKIRPQIKEILIDLYGVLNEYGENIFNYFKYKQLLNFGLLELGINKCEYIFRECKSVHPESEINYGIALFGYLLKSFYLNMDSQFLPSEVIDTCKYMGESRILTDYYTLAEVITGLWKNTPHSEETRVFVGLKQTLTQAKEKDCQMVDVHV